MVSYLTIDWLDALFSAFFIDFVTDAELKAVKKFKIG